ncbi:MAG: hypothetical protein OSB47_08585 [Pirellulaceae bacterium]|jgi:pyruvate/2-oxoglutarate/acetoin dehydrogenase E1 component|nr:hypothetical protein [Pirellulaceae bacterium]
MLFADEWYGLAELFLLAGDPLAFAADERGQLRPIVTMLTASFAAFLFAQLFSHEMMSQYQNKGEFAVRLP